MRNLLLFISVLGILSSCGGSKHVTHTEYSELQERDSTRYVERVIVDTIITPAETLEVEIPIEVLKVDTVMVFQKGRVKTKLVYQKGNIKVESTCDSLQQLILSYEKEIQSFKDKLSDQKVTKTEKIVIGIPAFYRVSAWVCGGLILAIIIYIAIKIVIKFYKPI